MVEFSPEFRLLGGVEVYVGGRPVDVGPARQRCVLTVLLVEANAAVSVDQLIDRVWGDHPPPRARGSLHSYLTRLRRALGSLPVSITGRSGTYLLTVDEQMVDLHRFRRVVARAGATADDEQALALFEQALRLWRGEAFAGLDTPWLAGLRAALERERTAARLARNDLALRCGRHAELLPELSTMASADPLDERVAGQLMLALYRSGRQADALQHYERTRRRLAEELGADPSPPLRRLHHEMLSADPALAGHVRANPPTPRQLPAAPRVFVGREHELDRLTSVLDAEEGATVVIHAIGGAGGIGKTSLALHWAHRNAHRFPDGQLHVNLRGFDPGGEPMPAEVALRGLLHALGVNAVPATVQAQSVLYRSLLADKRMLIVLDNALDTNQVVPLLPGAPGCTVVITSRNMLTGLVVTHAAHPVSVGTLDDDEARELLTRHLGAQRASAEPDALAELVRGCGGLPLALGIVAARAVTHPEHPLTTLADELRGEAGRLDALDTGELELSLRAVFSWSWHALSPEAATLFQLLGLAPGPDIGLAAAASLIAGPVADAAVSLRQLETAHAVQQPRPGRYRMHDLVRLYAAERARADLPDADRDAALRRLVDHYLHSAYGGERLLEPHRPPIELDPPIDGCRPHSLPDETAAMAWFEAEHPCLLAAQQLAVDRGWHQPAWKLAWAMDTFQYRRGRLHDQLLAWQRGLDAAERLDDLATQALAHRLIGHAHAQLGQNAESLAHLKQALTLAEDTGDLAGQAHTLQSLTWACAQLGDDRAALDHATRALRIYQAVGNPVGEARAHTLAGVHSVRLGDYERGRTHCEAALALYQRHSYPAGEAANQNALGQLAHLTGAHGEALSHYRHALTLCRAVGNAYLEAEVLDRLGQTHQALGHEDDASAAWHQALELYRAQHRTADAHAVQLRLAGS